MSTIEQPAISIESLAEELAELRESIESEIRDLEDGVHEVENRIDNIEGIENRVDELESFVETVRNA